MRKKRSDFDAVGVERMTDAELSKKLGSYQRTESISISLGVILVITACISMFIQRDPFLCLRFGVPRRGTVPVGGKARPNEEKSPDAAAAGQLLPHGADKSLRPGAGAGHAAHRLGVPDRRQSCRRSPLRSVP